MTSTQIANTVKAQLVKQLKSRMHKQAISQSDLARRMNTSRAVVYRLLKEDDVGLTLATLSKAAAAMGFDLSMRLV